MIDMQVDYDDVLDYLNEDDTYQREDDATIVLIQQQVLESSTQADSLEVDRQGFDQFDTRDVRTKRCGDARFVVIRPSVGLIEALRRSMTQRCRRGPRCVFRSPQERLPPVVSCFVEHREMLRTTDG